MSSDDFDEVWFWGSAPYEFVERVLSDQDEGTFVVFRPAGRSGELTLAIRDTDHVILKTIYHRDGLFGYTEPLGFEDLTSALEAYNSSQVDEGQLLNTLPRPDEIPPETAEKDVLMEFASVTELLLYLRKNNKLLTEKADEQEKWKAEMKRIDKEIESKMTSLAGLKKICSMMEYQKKLHANTKLKNSASHRTRTEVYTKNEEAIEAHILEIGKQVSAIEGEVRGKRHEHSLVAKDYSRCITEISGLESIQEQCKMRLESQPQLLDFIQGLLLNDDEDKDLLHWDRTTWFKDCTPKEAEKLLLDTTNLDGTFLVRPLKSKENTPYCVCVVWTTRTDKKYRNVETPERKVEKFMVMQTGDYFGFDPTTCVFESLEELIAVYSRIPFRVHDLKYGNMSLEYPVFTGQRHQPQHSPEVVYRK